MITTLVAAACSASASNYYNTCLPTVSANGNSLRIFLQVVFGILAAVAVLMIVIGGMRYVTSGGSPESIKQARGTILFALIGLIIAISAEALVGFVLGRV